MKIEDVLPDDVKNKLEKLRAKLKKKETSYEAFKEEMLTNPEVKEEYDKLEPKYKKIQKQLKKKGDKK